MALHLIFFLYDINVLFLLQLSIFWIKFTLPHVYMSVSPQEKNNYFRFVQALEFTKHMYKMSVQNFNTLCLLLPAVNVIRIYP